MENLKKNFLVCFGCNGHDYITHVSALSLVASEHVILDMGVCGKHFYSVDYAQAFDADSIKTDCFVGMALSASTVSLKEAYVIITNYNEVIRCQDARENRIAELTAKIDAMEKELSGLRSAPKIPL